MLTPKRTKYRRPHRISFEGKAKGGTELAFGEFGLVSKEGADTYILRMPEYAIMHFSLGIESKSYGINEDIKNHYNLDEISIDDVERFRAEIESGKIIVEYNDLDETISFTYV